MCRLLVGKFLKINKGAGCNKAIQVAGWNFSKINSEKNMQAGKIPKINKRAGCNKAVQVGIFQKINKMCYMFIR